MKTTTPCYGAHMPYAQRQDHTHPEYYTNLERDLWVLSQKKREFVVRLKELGDFYSLQEIMFWNQMLFRYPRMHIFGYSHCTGAIGDALDAMSLRWGSRFVIRDSDRAHQSTVRAPVITVDQWEDLPEGVVPCPEQMGQTASCSTCGLCCNNFSKIGFIRK